jgi:hypothetical protein
MLEVCLRGIDFLDAEVEAIDRALAELVFASPELRRLLTLAGVNAVTACPLLAAIGDIRRFRSSRQLVGYLGLDPRVRQSGSEPARHGRSRSRARARRGTWWSRPVGCTNPRGAILRGLAARPAYRRRGALRCDNRRRAHLLVAKLQWPHTALVRDDATFNLSLSLCGAARWSPRTAATARYTRSKQPDARQSCRENERGGSGRALSALQAGLWLCPACRRRGLVRAAGGGSCPAGT